MDRKNKVYHILPNTQKELKPPIEIQIFYKKWGYFLLKQFRVGDTIQN